MSVVEEVNDPIDVVTVFRDGGMSPVKCRWVGRTYPIERVGYKWVTREGAYPIHHFSVVSRDGMVYEIILMVLLGLCAKVGRRLRKGGHAGRTITLAVRYADFETIVRAHTAEAPMDTDRDLFAAVCGILDGVWRRDRAIRLLGVSVSNLVHRGQARQLPLFGCEERQRYRQVLRSVDGLRDRYGETIVTWGALVRGTEAV